MNVKLISRTVPVSENVPEGIDNAERLLAFITRVSNPSNQGNLETTGKLIAYMLKHKHWSPFEMVDLTIEVETTRDIARQILRHRSFTFQEFSQRYADPTKDLGFTLSEARLQDTKNRQNSIVTNDEELDAEWRFVQNSVAVAANKAYQWAAERGIAKELSRKVLPEGLTDSRLYVKGNLRSWITYIALREKSGTQKEHMDIAKACKAIVCAEFPAVEAALGGVDSPWVV